MKSCPNAYKQKWCVWTNIKTSHFVSALPGRFSASINHHRQWRQADSKHLIIWPPTLSWLMLEAESPQRKVELPFAHKLTSTVYPLQQSEKSSSLHLTSAENPQTVAECLNNIKVNVVTGTFQVNEICCCSAFLMKEHTYKHARQRQFSIRMWHRKELLFHFNSIFSVINPVYPILNWNYWRHWDFLPLLPQAIGSWSHNVSTWAT